MISAVVLSHNDQDVIKATLQSLSWCDEIVVVDDCSSDDTPKIAKSSGARVVSKAVEGDFAAQRNFALAQAKGEWVLFIDSDEVVSEKLKEEIKQAILIDDVAGYFFKRQDHMFGRPLTHGETGSVRLLRLARVGAGSWERPVHEVWKINGVTGELTHPLLHYPHPNVAQFLEEINFYSTLNAHYLRDQKVHVSGVHIVAYPAAKFFRNYVWHLGFLDGTAGAIVAIMMSFHSFLTRAKLYVLWHNKNT